MAHQMTPRLHRVRTVDGVAIAYTTIGTGATAVMALHGGAARVRATRGANSSRADKLQDALKRR